MAESKSAPGRGFSRRVGPNPALSSIRKRLKIVESGLLHKQIVNEARPLYQFSLPHALAGQSSSTDGTVNLEGVTKIRFTDIAADLSEDGRDTNKILYKGLFGEIMLVWTGLAPADGEKEIYPVKRLPVRIMIIQVFDEAQETTAFNTPPTLSDLFQNINDALAGTPDESATESLETMNGRFKAKSDWTTDTLAIDKTNRRQRKFKVWYDRKVILVAKNEHDGAYQAAAEAKISADGGAAAATLRWTNGLQRTTTDAEIGDEERYEKFGARRMVIPIRVPMNTYVTYLVEETQAISEVAGNIYLYIFCASNETNETQLSAADWPTGNGNATLAQTHIPQAFMRFRFKHYWQDVG